MDVAVQPASAEHPVHYERHRRERILLYQLVQEYYPAFKAHLEAQGVGLPRYVEREFEDYLKCGRLEGGFLRVQCETCHAERLVAYSCKNRSLYSGHPALRSAGQPAAVQNRSWRFCVRAAVRGVWPKAPRCWSMRSFPSSRCVSGC